MGERRALLDPEMYKISEEDSQDEEVLSAGALASYVDESLKLGEEATTISSWNNNVPPPVLPPKGWESGPSLDNSSYVHDDNRRGQASSSFSSAMHRFSGGAISKYKILQGQGQNQTIPQISNFGGNKFSFPVQDPEGDSVDWPDTSTNSDSCLSSDDRQLNKRQPWVYGSELESSVSNHKFVSRTYFGDDTRERERGDGSSFTHLNEDEDTLHTLGNTQSLPLPAHYQHSQPHNNHRRNYHRRSRRRSIASSQHGANYSESTSGSEYTDESSDESCNDCRHTARSGVNSKRTSTGEQSRSSSEAEDYEDESSYSESSFDEDDESLDNEYFEDIVKFLSDNEIEASTKPDGDLFLVEYSAESEFSDTDQPPRRISVSSRELTPQVELASEVEETSSVQAQIEKEIPDSNHSQSEKVSSKTTVTSTNDTLPPSPSTSHFQKSGKGAKGKISRLLKRRKGAPQKSESEDITGNQAIPSNPRPDGEGSSQMSPKISSSSTQSNNAPPAPKPTSSSTSLLSSIAKQKSRLGLKTSTEQGSGAQPEKVFRFKDEHGGETRTVFVDIPQSDGNGNLLGRRATLIESVLGILPGKFSTPAQNSMDASDQTADRIMVAGFVPDGVASRYRRIKIGDWLQSVDDIPVDHANVDEVLSSRSMYGKRRTAFETEYLRLKLTLTRVAGCMVSLPTSKIESRCDSPRSNTFVSTDLKWGTVNPNVQSHVAILYISSTNGSSNDNDLGNDALNKDITSNEETATTSKESTGAGSTSSKPEKSKDVVFCWPKESESKIVKALSASHGIFSTLYRLLWDVTGSHPLMSKVLIDDCEVDVTYTSEDQGKSIFLVGLATSLSTYNISYKQPNKVDVGSNSNPHSEGTSGPDVKKKEKKIRWREPQGGSSNITVSTRILARLENLLKYQFGTFSNAFKGLSQEKASRLIINAISALNDLSEDFIFPQVPGNFLRFPNCIRSGIDDVLYSFETSDTVSSSPKHSSRRSNSLELPVFYCHGSCLMYKGFLVTSHLENEVASSFHGWWRTQLGLWEEMKRNSLLERWKPVSRLAIWQQTFLPRKSLSSLDSRESQQNSRSPNNTRIFSAMVGIGNFSLGFVLEHLTNFNGHIGPDSGWIRRAMATLCRLYQSGLTRSFECCLEKQGDRHEFVELSGISPTSASKHHKQPTGGSPSSYPGQTKNVPSTQTLKKPGATNSILKNADAVQMPSPTCPIHAVGAGSTTSSSSSASSTCSCPTNQSTSSPFTTSGVKNFIGTSSLTLGSIGVRSGIAAQLQQPSIISSNLDSMQAGNDAGDSDGDETTTGSDSSSLKWYESSATESSFNYSDSNTGGEVKSVRVTRGNLLFDYIQIECGRGVILSSKDVHEGWASVIRHNFRQSVTIIHNILHKAAKARNRLEEGKQDKKWVSKALAPISEHGILFNCQLTEPRDLHKRKPRKREVNYWVVGRIYPDEREIYVCYEDGPLSQNMVELAYKIALNVHC